MDLFNMFSEFSSSQHNSNIENSFIEMLNQTSSNNQRVKTVKFQTGNGKGRKCEGNTGPSQNQNQNQNHLSQKMKSGVSNILNKPSFNFNFEANDETSNDDDENVFESQMSVTRNLNLNTFNPSNIMNNLGNNPSNLNFSQCQTQQNLILDVVEEGENQFCEFFSDTQGQGQGQSNFNNNNKKRNSIDIEREMREVENLFAKRSHNQGQSERQASLQGQGNFNGQSLNQNKKVSQTQGGKNFKYNNYNANNKMGQLRMPLQAPMTNPVETSILEADEEEDEQEQFFNENIPMNQMNMPTNMSNMKAYKSSSNSNNSNIKSMNFHQTANNTKGNNNNRKSNTSTNNNQNVVAISTYPQNAPYQNAPYQNAPYQSNYQNQPVRIEKSQAGNKKVTIMERRDDKETLLREYALSCEEIKQQLQEKRENLKKISNHSKLYEQLYIRMEDFRNRIPNIVERYLESYLRQLEEYNKLMSLDDKDIDQILEENEQKIERIREKFRI